MPNQQMVFDRLLYTCDPSNLASCRSLVKLSVAATVTSSLENHVTQRLNWLDVCLDTVNLDVSLTCVLHRNCWLLCFRKCQ